MVYSLHYKENSMPHGQFMNGERWAMFSARLREAVAVSGYSAREIAEKINTPRRTVVGWLSPTNPTIPRADEAAKLCRLLGTTVESLCFEEESKAVSVQVPYGDIIKMLNALPEERLDDVRRLIMPWANEIRGASQQVLDIVADLKILPSSRLEDLRRLIGPWAEESHSGVQDTQRVQNVG